MKAQNLNWKDRSPSRPPHHLNSALDIHSYLKYLNPDRIPRHNKVIRHHLEYMADLLVLTMMMRA
jgi:hypothetical protein